ncbi:MAG: GNAT family N-acetyltransferase [Pseudomonadota bacterium]|uniref:GNAT family N-acetyltransferase n=1 Tax=Gallaecimonas pentaromativorans TaxID=584787 RepID=UPI00067EBE97|nr:GNAT family N-acetyltransferase [Gallaecimonas pentaromativorans]MED5526886.1 GNAT family N-acetyltransferase [Pseudomonadota bacterium]
MNWVITHQQDLSTSELYACLALRTAVFVVEQNCPYQEVDGNDLTGDSYHLMAWENGKLLAYLRILDPALNQGRVIIGRVVTDASARDRKLGHAMMEKALAFIAERFPGLPVKLGAQAHLQGFYGRYGFVAEGEEYLEDGIPHIDMLNTST